MRLGWWGRQEGNKMGVQKFEDLIVWQKAMDLVEEIYRIVKLLPDEEIYALSAQMRRAVVSIPSNIAEGQERNTTKDFINFLYTARGIQGRVGNTTADLCSPELYDTSPKCIAFT